MELADMLERARERKGETLPSLINRREIRVQAGLTQANIAELLGVTSVTINRYETGSRNPKGANRKAYIDLLRKLSALQLESESA